MPRLICEADMSGVAMNTFSTSKDSTGSEVHIANSALLTS